MKNSLIFLLFIFSSTLVQASIFDTLVNERIQQILNPKASSHQFYIPIKYVIDTDKRIYYPVSEESYRVLKSTPNMPLSIVLLDEFQLRHLLLTDPFCETGPKENVKNSCLLKFAVAAVVCDEMGGLNFSCPVILSESKDTLYGLGDYIYVLSIILEKDQLNWMKPKDRKRLERVRENLIAKRKAQGTENSRF